MENPIQAEIILYQSEGTNVPVQVYYKGETLWVSQAAMAELFDVTVPTIRLHGPVSHPVYHRSTLAEDEAE